MSTNETVRALVPRPRPSVQGTLALDMSPRTEPPDIGATTTRSGADVALVSTALSTEAKRWSSAFTAAVVEVIAGDRPANQLVRWCTREVHAEIIRRAALVGHAGGHRPGQGRRRATPLRPQIASVHTCFITSAVVEVCAVVRHGQRSRFLAARIERSSGRWCCTVLEFG